MYIIRHHTVCAVVHHLKTDRVGIIGVHRTESKRTNRYVVVVCTFHFKGWQVYVELSYIEHKCTSTLSKTHSTTTPPPAHIS
jgi:hypothetical protein